jgi:hypothetical protein
MVGLGEDLGRQGGVGHGERTTRPEGGAGAGGGQGGGGGLGTVEGRTCTSRQGRRPFIVDPRASSRPADRWWRLGNARVRATVDEPPVLGAVRDRRVWERHVARRGAPGVMGRGQPGEDVASGGARLGRRGSTARARGGAARLKYFPVSLFEHA